MKLYHGSPKHFEPGDILLPGIQFDEDGCCEVYLTTDFGLAQQYATYDGYVYACEPIGKLEEDFCNEEGKPVTFYCDSAKIVEFIW